MAAGSDTRDKNSHLLCTMHVVKGKRRERFVCTEYIFPYGAQLRIVTSPSGSWSQLPSQGAGSSRLRICTERVFLYMTMEIAPVLFDGFISIPVLFIVYRAAAFLFYFETITDIFGLLRSVLLFRISCDTPQSPCQLSEATLYIKLSPPSHFIFNTSRRKSMDSGVAE